MKNQLLKFTFASSLLFTGLQSALADTEATRRAGDALQYIVPLTAFGLTFYKDDAEGRDPFYKSFATSLISTHVLKQTIDAERPNGGNHSFPSGHTSAAFHGAAFIHARYGISTAAPAYVAATFVGYSRVVSKWHHTQDVLAGALIGIGSSFYFTKPYEKTPRVSIQPILTGNYAGLYLSVRDW